MNVYLFQRILGIGVLILHLIIIGLVVYLVFKKINKKGCLSIDTFFHKYGMVLVGITAVFGIIGSLIFSDIYHIEPCKLCWLQRIMLYPQALIMLLAFKKRDLMAWSYSLWLSVIGLLIGLYQINEQFGISEIIPQADCVLGPDAACSQIHMLEFGYITFPVASATLFVFILILYVMRKNKKQL